MANFKVDHEKVNGWDVYLIDTGVGNEMSLSIRVETGSLHDDPKKHAGRAHLWEHVIFQGSKTFPDPNYYFNEANKFGATDANAYTADDHTLYLLKFHSSQFSSASKIMLSLFREPLMDQGYFITERDNVINEAKDYKARDELALNDGLLIYLLNEAHPFRMYSVGEEAQLNAMSMKDLATLYYSNYKPGSSAVFVSGNFRRPKGDASYISKEEVLEDLQNKLTSYQTPNEGDLPSPNKEKIFPPLQQGSFNSVEFKSADENVRSFEVIIPFDSSIDPIVVETLCDYLNIQLEGSLSKHLKDSNITNEFSVSSNHINNLQYLILMASLDKGDSVEQRETLLKELFKKIKALISIGLSEETLNFLQQRNVSSYEKIKDPLKAAEHLGEYISKHSSADGAFDFRKNYSQVTLLQLQDAAKNIFNKAKLLMSYVGPDIESTEMDPVFGRAYRRTNNQKILTDLEQIMNVDASVSADLEIPKFDLSFRESPLAQPDEFIKGDSKKRFLRAPFLVAKHSSNEGAAQVELEFDPSASSEEHAAIKIFVRAFAEEYRTLFTYFDALSIKAHTFQAGSLAFTASGNSKAALKVQEWFWPALLSFKPSEEILRKAKGLIVQANAEEQMSSFPPQITIRNMRPYFYTKNARQLEGSQLDRAIETMDVSTVTSLVQKLLSRTEINLSFYGDYSRDELESLSEMLKTELPESLSEEQRAQLESRPIGLNDDVILEMDLPSTKKVGDVSLMRAIPGAHFENIAKDSRKLRAFYAIAEEFLQMRVFDINRNEKALGYVQRAVSIKTKKSYWMLFLGMTGDLEKDVDEVTANSWAYKLRQKWQALLHALKIGPVPLDKIVTPGDSRAAQVVDGWKRSLELLKNLSKYDFEELRAGIVLRRKIEKVEIDELLDEAHTIYQQSDGIEHTMEPYDQELASITYEEFMGLSKVLLLDQKSALDVVSSRNSEKTRLEMAKTDSHFTCEFSLLLKGTEDLQSAIK